MSFTIVDETTQRLNRSELSVICQAQVMVKKARQIGLRDRARGENTARRRSSARKVKV